MLAVEHPLEQAVFRVLCVLLAVLFCSYFYFVGLSVINVIARKEAAVGSDSLESTISEMEKEYFALNTTVTEGSAASLGLKEIAATDYVYRPGTAAIATPEQERGI
ncbi:MAG TPA: hypothetical protein VJB97_02305 [Candidatus Paceibacterota bacterium]